MHFQNTRTFKRYFIVGGAGFIGSHFADHLLADAGVTAVTLYDNFSSGREWHYEHHLSDPRMKIIRNDVGSLPALTSAMVGHDVVIHLASNPDIARAVTEPEIDFYQGTQLTNNVVEAMRRTGIPRLLYASGSGVYGEIGSTEAYEDIGPLIPVSTYGASKLAGEALISSYCYMFGLSARVFRFGNVVGPRQTHGVGFDFVRRLNADPTELRILGDGKQSKSYIHVYDVVNAVLAADANDVRDAIARAEALTAARQSEDFAAISAAFKRIKNILRQAEEKGFALGSPKDVTLAPEAQQLADAAAALAPEVAFLRGERAYDEALARIATLRPVVDAFFDKVMVLDNDPAIRGANLGLIDEVLRGFSGIADFSEIVTT